MTAALRPPEAFAEAGIIHQRRPHPMIYDAFAHVPIYDFGKFGLCEARQSRRLRRRPQHRPARQAALTTDSGGLSYAHPGTCGMYALRESVRQMRGARPDTATS